MSAKIPKVKIRKYSTVTFLSPGSFVAEDSTRKTNITDAKRVARRAPRYSFAFYFEHWIYKSVTVEGEKFEKTEQIGKRSGKYYLGGKVYSYAEIKKMSKNHPGEFDTLLTNMRFNHWKEIIQCPSGNWQPFEKGDVFLKAK